MENYSVLVLVEDFFIAVECPNQEQPEIVQTTVEVELTEFRLTKQEVSKLERILTKLNFALNDAFSEVFAAASVTTDIRTR